jgi:hypothetical protein
MADGDGRAGSSDGVGVQEVVMESTARYCRPVWVALEETGIRKHLAHAHCNGARRRARVQSQIEGLLEDAQIKLSSVITDLLGAGGRRILEALAQEQGQNNPAKLAELGHSKPRATREELTDAMDGRWLDRHRFLLGTRNRAPGRRRRTRRRDQIRLSPSAFSLTPIRSAST